MLIVSISFLKGVDSPVSSKVLRTVAQIRAYSSHHIPLVKKVDLEATSEQRTPFVPWERYQALRSDEKEEFEVVQSQVQKFLTWGKMDSEVVPAFRERNIYGLMR